MTSKLHKEDIVYVYIPIIEALQHLTYAFHTNTTHLHHPLHSCATNMWSIHSSCHKWFSCHLDNLKVKCERVVNCKFVQFVNETGSFFFLWNLINFMKESKSLRLVWDDGRTDIEYRIDTSTLGIHFLKYSVIYGNFVMVFCILLVWFCFITLLFRCWIMIDFFIFSQSGDFFEGSTFFCELFALFPEFFTNLEAMHVTLLRDDGRYTTRKYKY